jgi:hypothetical protein
MKSNQKCVNFSQKQHSSTTSGLLASFWISTSANTAGCRADRKNRKYLYDNDGLNVNSMLTSPISCLLETCYQGD